MREWGEVRGERGGESRERRGRARSGNRRGQSAAEESRAEREVRGGVR